MNSRKLEKQKHCTMEMFLIAYVGINDDEIIEKLTSLTHKQFKEVYEKLGAIHLTRIPYEAVTVEGIETGDIILVLDSDNNIAPYINPVKANFSQIMDEEREKQIAKIYNLENRIQTFNDYTDDLDEIALDKGITSTQIKRLSLTRYKDRKEDK